MVKLQQAGKVKNIGVSNFTEKQLQDIIDGPSGVVPAVNQVELHPYLAQPELKAFCDSKGIVMMAYSPLGSGDSYSGKSFPVGAVAHVQPCVFGRACCAGNKQARASTRARCPNASDAVLVLVPRVRIRNRRRGRARLRTQTQAPFSSRTKSSTRSQRNSASQRARS